MPRVYNPFKRVYLADVKEFMLAHKIAVGVSTTVGFFILYYLVTAGLVAVTSPNYNVTCAGESCAPFEVNFTVLLKDVYIYPNESWFDVYVFNGTGYERSNSSRIEVVVKRVYANGREYLVNLSKNCSSTACGAPVGYKGAYAVKLALGNSYTYRFYVRNKAPWETVYMKIFDKSPWIIGQGVREDYFKVISQQASLGRGIVEELVCNPTAADFSATYVSAKNYIFHGQEFVKGQVILFPKNVTKERTEYDIKITKITETAPNGTEIVTYDEVRTPSKVQYIEEEWSEEKPDVKAGQCIMERVIMNITIRLGNVSLEYVPEHFGVNITEYGWLYFSKAAKMPFWLRCPSCAGTLTNLTFLANDSAVYFGVTPQYIFLNRFGNSTWRMVAWAYYNDETDYEFCDETETSPIDFEVAQGNKTGIGNVWPQGATMFYDNVYHFSNSSMNDSANRNNWAVAVGTVTINATSKIGAGVQMDASGEAVNTSFSFKDDLDGGQNFTMSLWFKHNDTTCEAYETMFGDKNSAGEGCDDNGIWMASGNVTCMLWGTYSMTTQKNTYCDGNWHHVLCGFENQSVGHLYLYVDGVNMTVAHTVGTIWDRKIGSRISARDSVATQRYSGYVDELILEERSLTEAEAIFRKNNTVGNENMSYAGGIILYSSLGPPNITINGNLSTQYIEQGTEVAIVATANLTTTTVCISADHGDIGDNFKCAVYNVSMNWTSSSNIRKFNDSLLTKQLTFAGAGTINSSLYPIMNDSQIESSLLNVSGAASAGVYPENVRINLGNDNTTDFATWGYLLSGSVNSTKFNDSLPYQSWAYPDRGSGVIYLKQPKHLNVSNATMNLTGGTGDYFASNFFTGFSNASGLVCDIYAPAVAARGATGYVYMFGAATSSIEFDPYNGNGTARYTPGGGVGSVVWKTPMPWIGTWAGAVYNPEDGYFYVFGGSNGEVGISTASTNMYRYNPSTDAWTARTALPYAKTDMEYVLLEGQDIIYICGGYNTTGYDKRCFSYDISADTYNTSIAQMPDGKEAGWAEVLNSTHLIFYGGTRRGAVSGGDTFLYNISGNVWVTVDDLPDFLYSLVGAKIGGNVYAWGGYENPGAYNTNVYRYNVADGGWDILPNTTTRTSGGTTYDVNFYYDECTEIYSHVTCLGSGGNGYGTQEYQMYFYPNTITVTVGDSTSVTDSYSGDFNTTMAVDDMASAMNSQLQNCDEDNETYCIIPIVITNYGAGTVNATALRITTNISSRIDLGGYNVSCASATCLVPIQVYSGAAGLVNLSNLSIDFLGTSSILIYANDSIGKSSSITANVYNSKYAYAFPANVQYIEFIPKTPTEKNVTPHGQTPIKPIINVTMKNTGGRNATWYFMLNDTTNMTCINTTISATSNKTDGRLLNNSRAEWINLTGTTNWGPEKNFGLWLFADYGCNFTTWKMWQPHYFFRACCQNCICSEATV